MRSQRDKQKTHQPHSAFSFFAKQYTPMTYDEADIELQKRSGDSTTAGGEGSIGKPAGSGGSTVVVPPAVSGVSTLESVTPSVESVATGVSDSSGASSDKNYPIGWTHDIFAGILVALLLSLGFVGSFSVLVAFLIHFGFGIALGAIFSVASLSVFGAAIGALALFLYFYLKKNSPGNTIEKTFNWFSGLMLNLFFTALIVGAVAVSLMIAGVSVATLNLALVFTGGLAFFALPLLSYLLKTLRDTALSHATRDKMDYRSLTRSLSDFFLYYFGLIGQNEYTNRSGGVNVNAAKFAGRWGSKAKFVLTGFYLTVALAAAPVLLFGASSISFGWLMFSVGFGVFAGALCGAMSNNAVLVFGLVELLDVKPKEKNATDKSAQKPEITSWWRWCNRFNGFAAGATCFSVALTLILSFSSPYTIAFQPFLLMLAAIGALGVSKGYYSLGVAVKSANKDFGVLVASTRPDGTKAGFFEKVIGRPLGILCAAVIIICLTVLNTKELADIFAFDAGPGIHGTSAIIGSVGVPIFGAVGGLQLSWIGILTIPISLMGAVGNFGLYFPCVVKALRGIARSVDEYFEERKIRLSESEQTAIEHQLAAMGFKKPEDRSGYKGGFVARVLHFENNTHKWVILWFNAFGNGAMAAVPATAVTFIMLGFGPLTQAIFFTCFVVGTLASVCASAKSWPAGFYRNFNVLRGQVRDMLTKAQKKRHIALKILKKEGYIADSWELRQLESHIAVLGGVEGLKTSLEAFFGALPAAPKKENCLQAFYYWQAAQKLEEQADTVVPMAKKAYSGSHWLNRMYMTFLVPVSGAIALLAAAVTPTWGTVKPVRAEAWKTAPAARTASGAHTPATHPKGGVGGGYAAEQSGRASALPTLPATARDRSGSDVTPGKGAGER